MKFLKFMLYLVLLVFFLWATLILFGPNFIRQAANFYLQDQLELSEISISSKLDVQIRNVSFDFTNAEQEFNFSGAARSLKFSPRIVGWRPHLELEIGPTQIGRVVTFKKFSANLAFNSFFNLDGIYFNSIVDNLKFREFGAVDQVSMAGNTSTAWHKLKEVNFKISNLNSQLFTSRLVTASLDKYDLKRSVTDQTNNFLIDLGSISSQVFEITAAGVNVNGRSELGTIYLDSNSNNIVNYENVFSINSLQNDIAIDLNKGAINFPVIFDLKALMVKDNSLSVDAKLTVSDYPESSFQIIANGKLKNLELINETIYLGEISSGSFESETYINLRRNKLRSSISVSVIDIPINQLALEVDAESSFPANTSFLNCFRGDVCTFGHSQFSYRLFADDERLLGSSNCEFIVCTEENFVTEIYTENTAKFFEKLASSRVFSPITLAYVYSLITSGDVMGDGHKIKF